MKKILTLFTTLILFGSMTRIYSVLDVLKAA